MVDLTTKYLGIELKNPLVAASHQHVMTTDQCKKWEKAGIALIELKSIIHPIDSTFLPFGLLKKKSLYRVYYDPKFESIWMHATFAHGMALPLDYGIKMIKDAKKALKIPISANFMPMGPVEEWVKTAKLLEEAGADILTISTCPLYVQRIPQLPDIIPKLKPLVDAMNIPVAYKIYPNVMTPWIYKLTGLCSQSSEVAVLAKNVGIKGLVMSTGGLPGMPLPNIEDGGKPPFELVNKIAPGTGAIGRSLLTCTYMNVVDAARAVPELDISAVGGITSWEHVIGAIMYGAKTAQWATASEFKGFKLATDMVNGIKGFMERKGYDTIEDFRRCALNYISDNPMDWIFPDAYAEVDEAKCDGCGKCTISATCNGAIALVDGKAKVDPEKCQGCGMCGQLCPTKAISLKPYKAA